MKLNRTRAVAAVFALLMVVAAATGGSMAATPSIDSETTNTAYTSEIVTDTVISGFSASADNESVVTLEGDNSTSPTVELSRNDSSTVVATNDSMANQTVGSWGTTWNGTISHDELADLEHTINENVTMDLTAHDGNESNSTTVQFYINTTDDRTVENLDDTDADEDTTDAPVTVESVENTLFDTNVEVFGISSTDFSTLDVEGRAVNGQQTDVVIVFSNTSVEDDASAAIASDVEDGDALYALPIRVEGDEGGDTWIRVYYEEAPDDIDEDDDTYAVFHDGGIGGEDGVVINLGETYEDEDEVAVTGTLNAGGATALRHWARTSSWNPLTLLGGLDLGLTQAVPLFAVGGAPAARRRQAAG